MGLRIIIEDYEGDTTIVPLETSGAPITVGRQEGNTIQLGEQNVSRAHARFVFDAERWVVEDLNSYNGIRVNGVLVDEGVSLEEGDVIQVGDYRLLFCSDKKKSVNAIGDISIQTESEDRRSTMVSMGNSITPEQILSAIPAQSSVVQEAHPTERVKKEVDTQLNTLEQAVAQVEESAVKPEPEETVGILPAAKALMVAVALACLAAAAFFASEPDSEEQTSGSELAVASEQGPASASFEHPRTGEGRRSDSGHPAQKEKASRGAALQASGEESDRSPLSRMHGSGTTPAENGGGADQLSDHRQGELRPDDDTMVWPIGTVLDEPKPADDAGGNRGEQGSLATPLTRGEDSAGQSKHRSSTSSKRNPAEPKNDQVKARELLQEAREASVAGKPSLAYRLAKMSFDANPSTDALQLMGVSACKRGKKKQAKQVLNQLRGAKNKNLLRAFCSTNGIDLG